MPPLQKNWLTHTLAQARGHLPQREKEDKERVMAGGILTVSVNGWTNVSKGDFNVCASLNLTTMEIVSTFNFLGDTSLHVNIFYTASSKFAFKVSKTFLIVPQQTRDCKLISKPLKKVTKKKLNAEGNLCKTHTIRRMHFYTDIN
jgi:hypothetical protein